MAYRTEAARAAAEIRKLLKSEFPSVKFSVRSNTYAGGDSIHINWTDGPAEKKVDDLVGKYEQCSFDGMTDMKMYTNSRDDIPQANYVFTRREMSDATELELRRKGYNADSGPYGFRRAFFDIDADQIHTLRDFS